MQIDMKPATSDTSIAYELEYIFEFLQWRCRRRRLRHRSDDYNVCVMPLDNIGIMRGKIFGNLTKFMKKKTRKKNIRNGTEITERCSNTFMRAAERWNRPVRGEMKWQSFKLPFSLQRFRCETVPRVKRGKCTYRKRSSRSLNCFDGKLFESMRLYQSLSISVVGNKVVCDNIYFRKLISSIWFSRFETTLFVSRG